MTRADRDIRGPPRTSAPTNAARTVGPRIMWRAGPHTYHVTRRAVYMVGADVLGRPPHAQGRRRWTMRPRGPPRTSAPTNTARTAGPRIISCGAQGRIHGRGGRPRPPAPRTHKDDAGGRCVRAGRRGRRPLLTPHSRGVQNRAHHVARRTVYMVGADVLGRPPPHRDDAGGRYVHAGRRGRRPLPTPHSRDVQGRAHHVARRTVYMVGAAGDVGPYQRRTTVTRRTARIMWRAG